MRVYFGNGSRIYLNCSSCVTSLFFSVKNEQTTTCGSFASQLFCEMFDNISYENSLREYLNSEEIKMNSCV